MRRATHFTILGAAAMAYLIMAAPAVQADNVQFNDNTGDHKWETAENWGDGTGGLPGSDDTAFIQGVATDPVVSAVVPAVDRIYPYNGHTLTIASGGSLTVSGNTGIQAQNGGASLAITGGDLIATAIRGGGAFLNVSISDGTLTVTDLLSIVYFNSTFTLSGGTFDGTGMSNDGFKLYTTYKAVTPHALFNIIGAAGTFSASGKNVWLAPNTTDGGIPPTDRATDVNFTFTSDADLTTVQAGTLQLANNALTIDFTDINRAANVGSHQVTLFDYDNLTGDFATPNFIGLGTGETASLVNDTTDGKYLLNFTLAVPEPASLLLLGVGGLLMLPRRRRERVTG